jgi:dihydrofolate synthase / folylpolyglutamate synthase
MYSRSGNILERLNSYHAVNIDLSLRDSYAQLLAKLGNPHLKLPPVIHVAGTNGKGSTIAFLRAMLEAAGKRVHVYTSPHLVTFHERIHLCGALISEDALCDVLLECERVNAGAPVTQFEIITAAAFLAFSTTPADILLLEVGLDATNVVPSPIATIITRISYDHRDFLGDSLEAIAGEKAGILKANIPAIIAPQASRAVTQTLDKKIQAVSAQPYTHHADWNFEVTPGGFIFNDGKNKTTYPAPSLLGEHQIANAATAIATLTKLSELHINHEAICRGLSNASWPARLQRLTYGPLVDLLPNNYELWLDGGHNDSAGDVLAKQAQQWNVMDGKPLLLMVGMLNSKHPQEFLSPLAAHITALAGISIPQESKSLTADAIMQAARAAGILNAQSHRDITAALSWLTGFGNKPARILICGSLYLAGVILQQNK